MSLGQRDASSQYPLVHHSGKIAVSHALTNLRKREEECVDDP